ncbi:retention module-containing protein, partial [Pseudomonas citronellolis]|uniref:retention module-containing protein n=1 Tax=Pseudomonas citronellolis TaxID=53408 RepID=UPI0023E3DD55
MASQVGVVSKVVGEVFAVAADGSRRILHQGDKLFVGEQLVTGHEGAVAVAIAGGGELTLGRDSSMPLSPQLVAAAHHQYSDSAPAQQPVAPSQKDVTDVKALQAAIAAGADPTQTAEATAAGPSFSAGGNAKAGGGHSFVLLTETGGRVDPDIGFPTGPQGSGPLFPPPFDGIARPEQAQATPPTTPTDGTPSAGSASAVVDEDGLPGGIQGNDNLPGVGATATGTLGYDFGSDGPGTFAWSTGGLPALTSGGVPLTYSVSPDGHVLTASANGQPVFTLTLTDIATGAFELVLQQPLDHPVHGVEDTLTLSVPYTVTDGNGTPASGSLSIGINDDSPTASLGLGGEAPDLLTHDAATVGGTDSASADFSTAFKASLDYGADGAGNVTWQYSLGVTSQGEASGLSSGGQSIHLYLIGGVVVGSTAASAGAVSSANTVFSLAVDASGKVTLTQFAAIDHQQPGVSSAFDSQHAVLDSGLVQLQGNVTITDRDGDPATASQNLDLGGKVSFADDGPSIAIGLGGEQAGALVTQDADTLGGNVDTATASFAGAFVITAQNAGADTPATVQWSYALKLASAGVDSGLTSAGQHIYLYQGADGQIVGSTSSSAAGVTAGNTVFGLSVDASGNVTLSQYAELDHVQPAHDQQVSLDSGLVSLEATATITDHDGDSAKASASLDLGGKVSFDDAGPSIAIGLSGQQPAVLETQDHQTIGAASDTSTSDFSGAFVITSQSAGPDAPATVQWSYALKLANAGVDSGLSSAGQHIYLYQNADGQIVGSTSSSAAGVTAGNTIFGLGVDTAGKVTLTQYAEIDHALPGSTSDFAAQKAYLADGLVQLEATATITDYDGDKASSSASVDLGHKVVFDDDGPCIEIGLSGNKPVLLHTQDADTIGAHFDTATSSFAGAFAVTSQSAGADTPATVQWSYGLHLNVNEGSASGLSSAGHGIYLYQDAQGQIIGSTSATEGGVNAGNTIFSLKVDGGGNVTLIQYAEIDHALPGASGNYAAQQAFLGTGLVSLDATATITDYDGDKASSTASLDLGNKVAFDDDGPCISVCLSGNNPAVLHTQDADTIGANFDTASTSFAAAFAVASQSAGADTPATVKWSYGLHLDVNEGSASGLSSSGQKIYLYEQNGQIVGSTSASEGGVSAGNTIFGLSVDAAGKVTLTQYAQIDHALPGSSGNYAAQQATLGSGLVSLQGTATITDFDGDKASDTKALDLGGKIAFDDDGPSICWVGGDGALTVDESCLASNTIYYVSTLFNSNYGADGPGSISYQITTVNGTDSGFKDTASGKEIYLFNTANGVEGRVGDSNGQVAFSFTLSNGLLTLDQQRAMVHPNAGDPNDALTLGNDKITLTATITDYDGDKASVSVDAGGRLVFLDDGPCITVNGSFGGLTVDETHLDSNASTNVANLFQVNYGADGAAKSNALSYQLTLGSDNDSGLKDTASGKEIFLYKEGNSVVGRVGDGNGAIAFSVTLDGSGNVTLDQQRALLHSNASDPNDALSLAIGKIGLSVTATDGDGDKATTSIDLGSKLTFLDDGPTAVDDNPGCLNVQAPPAINLTLVVDVSGSMQGTKLAQAQAALVNMIHEYASMGLLIHVALISFQSSASAATNYVFDSASDAGYSNLVNAINGLHAGGDTNYQSALAQAQSSINSVINAPGADPSALNRVYFISDGQPTVGNTATALSDWQTYLAAHNGTSNNVEAFAVGVGTSITDADLVAIDSNHAPVIVTNPSDLSATLVNLATLESVSGNVLANDLPVSADGTVRITQVSIGGETFAVDANGHLTDTNPSASHATATYDSTSGLLTVQTDSGTLTLYMKDAGGHHMGDYTYAVKAGVAFPASGQISETFNYTIVDGDGDSASANLNICLKYGQSVLVVGSNASDTDGSTPTHIVPSPIGTDHGTITGSFGNDVLLGDAGGVTTTTVPGKNYNIALIIDTSGSMDDGSGTKGLTRMDLAKAALINLLNQISGHDGTINLALVSFSSNATLAEVHGLNSANVGTLISAIQHLDANGGTNYEAALQSAAAWFN